MNLVSLPRLNELRFPADPQPMAKLWRWCREGRLPARKVGGEWFVDLEALERAKQYDRKAVEAMRLYEEHFMRPLLNRMFARVFRITLPARGVKIKSRRRAKVWLKQVERGVVTSPEFDKGLRELAGIGRAEFTVCNARIPETP